MSDTSNPTSVDPAQDTAPQLTDDAVGYYTPGEPIRDIKAPSGPLEER